MIMNILAEQFREFLLSSQVTLEEGKVDDSAFFAISHSIESALTFKVIAYFPDYESQVSIFSLNYICDFGKRDLILEKINALNVKYTYCKFTLNDDCSIQASVFLDAKNTFSPNEVLEKMFSICQVLEDE